MSFVYYLYIKFYSNLYTEPDLPVLSQIIKFESYSLIINEFEYKFCVNNYVPLPMLVRVMVFAVCAIDIQF